MEALHTNYYGKIKSRQKSLGKETEKNRLKKERNSSILPEKKRALPKATKALGLAKYLQQSRHLLKIRSGQKSLELVTLLTRVLPLPLASLAIILRPRPELNLSERDKKCVAMRCFSREILTYCHRR